ncbi:MAG: polyprenyl synthetase family protein [Marmoricola sp.]
MSQHPLTAPPPLPAADQLAVARELVLPALRAAVDRLDPDTRLVAAYHLGWCDTEGRPVTGDPGKAVRPGLALLAAQAVCGDTACAVPGAVAVELVHNFSLVHDDLMDRDAERRHRPTVWSVWGDATAVLAGDAMASLAQEVVIDSRSPYALDALGALARATRELIRGQVLDVAFENRDDVTLAACLDMAGGKTGALLGVSAEIGGILAGATGAVRSGLREYGEQLGLAFQLVDDVLGIWGWPERTGKPVFSDLQAHKKTLPVVWTLRHGGTAGAELGRWLAGDAPHEEAALRRAADLIEDAGGRSWATAEARARVDRALEALAAAGLDEEQRAPFEVLAAFCVERDL